MQEDSREARRVRQVAMAEAIRLSPGQWVEQLSKALADEKGDQGFLSRALLAHLDCACFGLSQNGNIVSFSAVHFSSRGRRNAWGKYMDWRVAYTPMPLRRSHYATELWSLVKQEAIASGHARVRGIAKGKLGFYLHRSLGHQFWGWDRGGRGLVVDSRITDGPFPEGTPIEARCAVDAHLMMSDELDDALAILL